MLNSTDYNPEDSEMNENGELISSIEFFSIPEEWEEQYYEDGIMPWAHIDSDESDLEFLINPDEIVLPFHSATLIVDYPMDKPLYFEITSKGEGFSRKELSENIWSIYKQIYSDAEMSKNIWWHDIGELDLVGIQVYKKSDNKIYLLLEIDS